MINIEWILLVVDYYRSLTTRNFVLEWAIPLLIGELIFINNINNTQNHELMLNVIDTSLSLLGVLIGFSIAVITLLITSSSPNIDEIKQRQTSLFIGRKRLSLFDLQLINYTYSVIAEVFLVITLMILQNVVYVNENKDIMYNVINSIVIFCIFHILLLTVRNITNFYFIIFKKSNVSN